MSPQTRVSLVLRGPHIQVQETLNVSFIEYRQN
jgi:hypothetical protein